MKKIKSFTFVEILVIVGVVLILLIFGSLSLRSLQSEFILQNTTEKIVNTLRLAQNKTLASEGSSQWGVYFQTSTPSQSYILFKGKNFQSRTISSDNVYELPSSLEFYEINLGGTSEVVFNKVLGTTNQAGFISLRLKAQPDKKKNIFIDNSGFVGVTPSSFSDEERFKDSRHVHFSYSRDISTSTEKLILNFSSGYSSIVYEIEISENIKDNQFFWEGEINIDGEPQKLKIHTHYLNDPTFKTLFCIHRDRRYNNKALTLNLDDVPDPDPGTLISFDTEGQTQKGSSIYVSEPIWQ